MKPLLPSLAPLDDPSLLEEVTRLARSMRSDTVMLVARLAELDARRLYLGAGFNSLFAYCTGELKLSEHEATSASKPPEPSAAAPSSSTASPMDP